MRSRIRLPRLGRLLLALCASMFTSACGFLFVQAPPQGHEQMASFNCTESNAGPVLDIIWGGLNVLGALAAAGDPDAYANPDQVVAVGLAWGALSGASAAVGIGKTGRCREARRLLIARQGPAGLTSPPLQPGVAAPVAVVITPPSHTIRVGDRDQLVAAAYSSSGTAISSAEFIWSSSNDAIASVNASGLVTATAPGTVVIAARSAMAVGTATIEVTAN
jgi:hypothetical protein